MKDEIKRTIVVCFSRDRSLFSWFTYFADGGGFTHAAISFDEDADHYYSFNLKGFRREYISSLKRRPREMKRYKISVTEEQYRELKKIIKAMEKGNRTYKYDRMGAVLSLMKLPNGSGDDETLFCSQFVAKVLDESGCVEIKKAYGELTPNALRHELERSGRVTEVEDDSTLTTITDEAAEAIIRRMERGKNIVVDFSARNMEYAAKNGLMYPPFLLKIGIGTSKTGRQVYRTAVSVTRNTTKFAGSLPEKLAAQTGKGIEKVSGSLGKIIGRR